MRAKLKKILLLGICTTAGSFGSAVLLPSSAQAQFSPCQAIMPGYLAPPPCITFDYKRLVDIATKRAQDAQRVAAKVEEVKGWANGQAIIGKVQQAVGVNGLAAPQVLTGMSQSFPNVGSTTTFLQAKDTTSALFAEADSGSNVVSQVQNNRDSYVRSAVVDSMALGYRKESMLKAAEADAARINKAAQESTDLRTDWAVNSEARRAVAQAMVTQNYLWQAFLQLKSTGQIQRLPVGMGAKGINPSASTAATAGPVDDGDLARLQQLVALNSEAQNLLSRLGGVKSIDQLSTMVTMTKADCADTISRQANLDAQLPQLASKWACNAKKCNNAGTIMSVMKNTLNNWEQSLSPIRSSDLSSSAMQTELAKRFTPEQLAIFSETNVDPRQFVATWGDPIKYDMLSTIAGNLSSDRRDAYNGGQSLNPYINGTGDNAEFAQMLYDYEDVRQELAWKNAPREKDPATGAEIEGSGGSCTEAAYSEGQLDTLKADFQKESSTALNADAVTARLQAIAAEGNGLGTQLAQSQDPNTVEAARQHLAELQATLDGGTKLPEPALFAPEVCDGAAAYLANPPPPEPGSKIPSPEPITMTAEEIAYCKQQGSTSR